MTSDDRTDQERGRARGIPKSIIGAALAVGALVLVAVLVVLVADGRQSDFPADSPEGTVQSYLRALENDDVESAYGSFSSAVQSDMTLTAYRRVVREQYYEDDSRRIALDRVDVTGDRARLFLTIQPTGGGGLFGGGGYTDEREIPLVHEAGGWRIDEPLAGIDPIYLERF